MERVSNKHSEDYPAVTLYFDDLQEIIDTFSQVCKKLEIQAGEFRITEASELEALATKYPDGRFPSVDVKGYTPYITVEFRPFGLRTYVSEDTIEQRGVISKVREVVERRRKPKASTVGNAIVVLLLIMAGWLVTSGKFLALIPTIGAIALALWLSFRLTMRNTVVVLTTRRAATSSFWRRKKDDVVLALIAAGLGAATTYIVTKLVQ